MLIVDCQTTGASPAHGVVLELGWCSCNGTALRDVEAHWITLPPGHRVSAQVRRLTGFDEANLDGALAPEEAWRRLRAAARARARVPTAIHFAQFELPFLRHWAERFEPGEPFPLSAVCVHAIACRFFPELPRRSLRALAGFLGFGLDPARRSSLDHVEATAFVWQKLVARLAESGIHTWDQLEAWLGEPVSRRRARRRYPLPSSTYRALPDAPGVYRFLRSNGDLLYVGKAQSLKKRVASHFTAGTGTTERALEMLTQVSEIRTTVTASALEAALLENEEIKALAPPYNVQLIESDPRTWFLDAALDGAASSPDVVHRRGPLPSTFAARGLGAVARLLAAAPDERVPEGAERASPEHAGTSDLAADAEHLAANDASMDGSIPGATLALRARAVNVPPRWAPDEATFSAGLALFITRHGLDVAAVPDHRRAIARLAPTAESLLAASRTLEATPDAGPESAAPNAWDAERVARHLERSVLQGYQLLQRARWLCLIFDSAIVVREPRSERLRLIAIHNGRLAAITDITSERPALPPIPLRPRIERQALLDRSHYDRLRTLTSELKRVVRDGGTVDVWLGRGRWLGGARLASILRRV